MQPINDFVYPVRRGQLRQLLLGNVLRELIEDFEERLTAFRLLDPCQLIRGERPWCARHPLGLGQLLTRFRPIPLGISPDVREQLRGFFVAKLIDQLVQGLFRRHLHSIAGTLTRP